MNGFTLVEILIGMVISLIGMILMFQAMSVWDARKRTTASGSDAQVAGSIAQFQISRDLDMAGYGFGNASAMGCTVNAYDITRTAPGTFTFTMAPVLISDGAAGTPDTVTVLYGSGSTMSANQTFTANPAGSMTLNTRIGLRTGDLVIGSDAATAAVNNANPAAAMCGLFEVTANNNADALSVSFGAGAYTNYMNNDNVTAVSALAATPLALLQQKFLNNTGTARYNNNTAQSVGATGSAFNLGPGPRLNVWAITNRRFLTVRNRLANETTANATEVAEGIINLQAEYGIDANNDGLVSNAEWTSTTPTTIASWRLLRSVRIALLARSQQYEAGVVTTTAPTWAGGAFTMTDLNGTVAANDNTPNDWRHYRYRVYETVVPLRNMLWGI